MAEVTGDYSFGTDRSRSVEVESSTVTIRRHDGIHFDLGQRVIVDSRSAVGDVNVMSHAHADHTVRSPPQPLVCSQATAAIAAARTGLTFESVESLPGIELVSAGHVVGSSAVCIDGAALEGNGQQSDQADDSALGYRRYCYTGDFSIRDRGYLDGFDPGAIKADVLVMETTYGHPTYRFPSQDKLESDICDWLVEHDDRPLFLFGYSLGRAQKLQWLVQEETDRPCRVSKSIAAVNRAIESTTDLEFKAETYDDHEDLQTLSNDIVVIPSNQSRSEWVDQLVERTGALKAGFSGWAVDDSYQYRGDYDATFALTDHCDFDELIETVRTIDPDVVYTHHGFDEPFADVLETEHGYRARPLKRNQTTLEEFSN